MTELEALIRISDALETISRILDFGVLVFVITAPLSLVIKIIK